MIINTNDSAEILSEDETKKILVGEKRDINELSNSARKRYTKMAEKYKIQENLIIARSVRKTIVYIEKNVINFPNKYNILKSNIINTLYELLECVYRANVLQDINDKKEAVVKIRMLNFYLERALNEDLIKYKKFQSYTNYLIEIDNMIRSWFKYDNVLLTEGTAN